MKNIEALKAKPQKSTDLTRIIQRITSKANHCNAAHSQITSIVGQCLDDGSSFQYLLQHVHECKNIIMENKDHQLLLETVSLIDLFSMTNHNSCTQLWHILLNEHTSHDGWVEKTLLDARSNSESPAHSWVDIGKNFSIIEATTKLDNLDVLDTYPVNVLLLFLTNTQQVFLLSKNGFVAKRLLRYFHKNINIIFPSDSKAPYEHLVEKLSLWSHIKQGLLKLNLSNKELNQLNELEHASMLYAHTAHKDPQNAEIIDALNISSRPDMIPYMNNLNIQQGKPTASNFWQLLNVFGATKMKGMFDSKDDISGCVQVFIDAFPQALEAFDHASGWHKIYMLEQLALMISFIAESAHLGLKEWEDLHNMTHDAFCTKRTHLVPHFLHLRPLQPTMILWFLEDDTIQKSALKQGHLLTSTFIEPEILNCTLRIQLMNMLAKKEAYSLHAPYIDAIIMHFAQKTSNKGISMNLLGSLMISLIESKDIFVVMCITEHISRLAIKHGTSAHCLWTLNKEGFSIEGASQSIDQACLQDIAIRNIYGIDRKLSKSVMYGLAKAISTITNNIQSAKTPNSLLNPLDMFATTYLLAKSINNLDLISTGILMEGLCTISANDEFAYVAEHMILPSVLKDESLAKSVTKTTMSIMKLQRRPLYYPNWKKFKSLLPHNLDPTAGELKNMVDDLGKMHKVFIKISTLISLFTSDREQFTDARARLTQFNMSDFASVLLESIQGKYTLLTDKTLKAIKNMPVDQCFKNLGKLPEWAGWAIAAKPCKLISLLTKAETESSSLEVATWVASQITHKVRSLYAFIDRHITDRFSTCIDSHTTSDKSDYIQALSLINPPKEMEKLTYLINLAQAFLNSIETASESNLMEVVVKRKPGQHKSTMV